MKLKILSILIIASTLVCFPKNKAKPSKAGIITFMSGDVQILNKELVARKIRLKEKILAQETIITGERSVAVFQVKDLGIFRVSQNSKLHLISLWNNSEFQLKQGGIFSNINKLRKDQTFSVKTPTTVAGVRGTQFLVTSKNKNPQFFVSSGKIEVKILNKPNKKKVLNAGEMAVVSETKVQSRHLDKIEKLQMEKLAVHEYQEEVETITVEEIKVINKKAIKVEEKIEKTIKQEKIIKTLSPLERLKKKGKILTKLHLRDGSQLTGTITWQDGKNIKIDLGDNVITLPKKIIIRREDQ